MSEKTKTEINSLIGVVVLILLMIVGCQPQVIEVEPVITETQTIRDQVHYIPLPNDGFCVVYIEYDEQDGFVCFE